MSERRRLACCEPFVTYFPSGSAWAHSKRCRARDAFGGPRRQQKVLADEWLPDPDCPTHPGEDYVACRGCEAIAEDRIQGDQMWEVRE